MEIVPDLPDINPSDTVFTDGTSFVKVRVLEVPIDPASDPQAARNCIVLQVSASICGADGKALPDEALGHLIAPASRHTCQLQGMVEKAIKSLETDDPKSPEDQVDAWADELMVNHARDALYWLRALSAKSRFVKLETATPPVEESNAQPLLLGHGAGLQVLQPGADGLGDAGPVGSVT